MIDPAHLLFPSDAPTVPADVPPARPAAPAAPAQAATQPPAGDDTNPAEQIFKTELPSDGADLGEAVGRLDDLASSLRVSEPERAAALTDATDELVNYAIDHDMPAGDLREIVEAVHVAADTLSPMTPEQLADGHAKAMRELSDVPAADLDLARGLIREIEKKIPGTMSQLEYSGLGNRPEFIRAVVKEARRRAGR